MSNSWYRYGPLMIKIKHVQWRRGIAKYRRPIPEDIRSFYDGKKNYFESLKTKDAAEAVKKSQELTKQLDRKWSLLRSSNADEVILREQGMAILQNHNLEPGQASEYAKHDLEPAAFVNEL